jgi:hypothetical protein
MINKLFILAVILCSSACTTATAPVEIEFVGRTQDQMASFYEARGFPDEMLKVIEQHCLFTTRITNVSDDVVWLEMENWEFTVDGKVIAVKSRKEWREFWTAMGIPKNHQTTFHWTQIPDSLDYLPGEEEGGNISFPRTNRPISVKASFSTGKDKKGPVYHFEKHSLECADAPS